MSEFIPPKPSGNSREARFAQWTWERLQALVPRDSPDIKFQRSSRGYTGVIVVQKAKPAGAQIKGEWTAAVAGTEKLQEIWRISAGVSAGTYACVQESATNTDPPSEGSPKWFMLAKLTAGGQWL